MGPCSEQLACAFQPEASEETFEAIHPGSETSTHPAGSEVMTMVRRLADEEHSAALDRLTSSLSAIMKFSAETGDNPFVKVKGLVMGLISRLRDESSSQANQKAYCDEEMSKLTDKKDLKADSSMHSSKLETAMFRSTTLNGEISALQSELDALSKWPLQMTRVACSVTREMRLKTARLAPA